MHTIHTLHIHISYNYTIYTHNSQTHIMGQCTSSQSVTQADLDILRERLSQQTHTNAVVASSISDLSATVTTLGRSVEEIIDIIQALNANQQHEELRSPQVVDDAVDLSNNNVTVEDEPTNST